MYVPIVTTMVTTLGQVPCNKLNKSRCFVMPGIENLQMLKTQKPEDVKEDEQENRLNWEPVTIHRRFLKPNQPPKKKQHNFGETIWPRITSCNPMRNYMYITGGLNNTTRKVSD